MVFREKTIWAVGGLVSLGLVSAASAAIDTTDPFEGLTVTYSDVEEETADPVDDPGPLYGDPVLLSGDLLDFMPSSFPFASSSPPADTTDGALTFTVTANDPLATIPGIIISEGGDFSFLGLESDSAVVSAGLFVQILDTTTSTLITQASATFVETFDEVPSEGGFWSNEVVIDLTPYALGSFDVIINNTLQAAGSDETSASIRKKTFQVNVPEPGTLALFCGGLALMTLRRKSA